MIGDVTTAQQGWLDRWKGRVGKFFGVFDRLESRKKFVTTLSPSIKREYAQMMAKGMGIKSKIAFVQNAINKVTGAFTSVKDWFKETFGLGEYEAEIKARQQMGEMDGVFILPIAMISSAVAVIVVWIKDAEMLDRRLTSMEKLIVEKNIPVDRARDIVNNITPPTNGIFSMLGFNIKPLMPAAIGIGIFILLQLVRGNKNG